MACNLAAPLHGPLVSVPVCSANAPDAKDGHLLLFANLPTCIEVIGVLGAAAHAQVNSTSCFESFALR